MQEHRFFWGGHTWVIDWEPIDGVVSVDEVWRDSLEPLLSLHPEPSDAEIAIEVAKIASNNGLRTGPAT